MGQPVRASLLLPLLTSTLRRKIEKDQTRRRQSDRGLGSGGIGVACILVVGSTSQRSHRSSLYIYNLRSFDLDGSIRTQREAGSRAGIRWHQQITGRRSTASLHRPDRQARISPPQPSGSCSAPGSDQIRQVSRAGWVWWMSISSTHGAATPQCVA